MLQTKLQHDFNSYVYRTSALPSAVIVMVLSWLSVRLSRMVPF